MKIGEWEGIGRSRALVAHQLGELGADEFAAHVTMFENGRQRRIRLEDYCDRGYGACELAIPAVAQRMESILLKDDNRRCRLLASAT